MAFTHGLKLNQLRKQIGGSLQASGQLGIAIKTIEREHGYPLPQKLNESCEFNGLRRTSSNNG